MTFFLRVESKYMFGCYVPEVNNRHRIQETEAILHPLSGISSIVISFVIGHTLSTLHWFPTERKGYDEQVP